MELLDRIKTDLDNLPPKDLEKSAREILALTQHMKWIPSPGPQLEAYESKADVLLYGGEPGGGKTDLILGLAFNCHQRSLIMRRQYTDLGGLVDRMLEINGGRNGFNGSPPPKLKSGRLSVELGAAKSIGDEQNFQGRPRDLLAIDEATQFAEMQVRMLMGWVRTADPKQRCRVVLATNPPLTSEGQWVIKMFAPWLDDTFPFPADPGELRWVVTDEDGDRWVDGPDPVIVRGELVNPTSRTYIPSSVQDNPFLNESGYKDTLDALPEPIRRILMGGFKASFKDQENQIIPTAWIREAQKRWTPHPPHGVPMCAIGVDCSGGGDDPLAIAPRYDGWFAPIKEIAGKLIPKDKTGSFTFSQVLIERKDSAIPVIDMGGGYGSGCYELMKENEIEVCAYKGAEKSLRRTKDKQLPFFNVRSQALYQFREALDPDQPGGSQIALPDDPMLVADLTSPTLDLSFRGIKAESKEDVCKRIGRSTNRGDAVIMAWFAGPKVLQSSVRAGGGEQGMFGRFRNKAVNVVMGRRR